MLVDIIEDGITVRVSSTALKPRIKKRIKSCIAKRSFEKKWKLSYYYTDPQLKFNFVWFDSWFECVQELAWAYAHKNVIR